MRILIVLTFVFLITPIGNTDWKYPLENWAKLESPLVEVTPFMFKNKLYLMESWQKQWGHPKDKTARIYKRTKFEFVIF